MKRNESSIGSGIAALLVVGSALLASPAAGAKEGFGASKETVRLEWLVVPAVALSPASFAVRTVEQGATWSPQLEEQLAQELAARDGGLVADASRPQVVIELKVLRNELNGTWESKPERERRQAGFDQQGKALYQSVEVLAQFQVLVHHVAVGFEVIQAATGKVLDAGTVEAPFEGRFRDGEKAPTTAMLEAAALGKVVEGIASRLTPARKPIAVLLPKGRLESFAALAGAGQWGRYRDAVAALPPSPEPQDEAYRQYALATASEALAYAATAPDARLEQLKLAESRYQAAIAAHPAEKLFVRKSEAGKDGTVAAAAPLDRVRAALAGWQSRAAASPPASASGAAAPALAREVPDGAMGNAEVIRMTREGKGGYAILKAIKAAPALAFDLSPEGLLELSEAGVDPKIIGHMQEASGAE